jgi:hypothetical protein
VAAVVRAETRCIGSIEIRVNESKENQMNTSKLTRRLSIALGAVMATLAIAPATGMASTTFGTNLDPDLQPSNAGQPHPCSDSTGVPGDCTWIENEAYTNGDPTTQTTAPKTGTIKKISWIAGAPGEFRFVVGKVKADGSAKITHRSKTIQYQGQSDPNADTYEIESAKVKAAVKKGQYLGIEAEETSMLRCSSGGDNVLLYQPPLQVGNPFVAPTADDGCWLLLQAKIK